jgi:hypothetical protein
MNGWELGAVIGCWAYNLTVVAGFAYLVTTHNWSPWWVLLVLACMRTIKTGKAAEESICE